MSFPVYFSKIVLFYKYTLCKKKQLWKSLSIFSHQYLQLFFGEVNHLWLEFIRNSIRFIWERGELYYIWLILSYILILIVIVIWWECWVLWSHWSDPPSSPGPARWCWWRGLQPTLLWWLPWCGEGEDQNLTETDQTSHLTSPLPPPPPPPYSQYHSLEKSSWTNWSQLLIFVFYINKWKQRFLWEF